jgi:hypothetical protein
MNSKGLCREMAVFFGKLAHVQKFNSSLLLCGEHLLYVKLLNNNEILPITLFTGHEAAIYDPGNVYRKPPVILANNPKTAFACKLNNLVDFSCIQ